MNHKLCSEAFIIGMRVEARDSNSLLWSRTGPLDVIFYKAKPCRKKYWTEWVVLDFRHFCSMAERGCYFRHVCLFALNNLAPTGLIFMKIRV
jgi:hypothetical protein